MLAATFWLPSWSYRRKTTFKMGRPEGGYGDGIIGVTTITGYFKPKPAVDRLIGWGRAQGAAKKDPTVTLEEAGDIGSLVHNMVTAHIEGRDPHEILTIAQENQAALRAYRAFSAWVDGKDIQWEFWEKPLISEMGFGGTPDAIGMFEGIRTLFDWKTSSGIWPEQYTPQVAAYIHLWHEHNPELPIERSIIVRLSKTTGKPEQLRLYPEELRRGWEHFLRSWENYKDQAFFETLRARIEK